jgi:hypothetical protein
MTEALPNGCVLAAIEAAPLAKSTHNEVVRRLRKLTRLVPGAASAEDAFTRPEEALDALERVYCNRSNRNTHIAAVLSAFKHCSSLALHAPDAHAQGLSAHSRFNAQLGANVGTEEWATFVQYAQALYPLTLAGLLARLVTELPPQRAPELSSLCAVSAPVTTVGNSAVVVSGEPCAVVFAHRRYRHITSPAWCTCTQHLCFVLKLWIRHGGLPSVTPATVAQTVSRSLAPLHQFRHACIKSALSQGKDSEQVAACIDRPAGSLNAV